ncbi:hypothetical protein BTH42_25130 [Burkholderia sp. SRS-W-2-2016]|uniref:hypothetical protein n=1 Tax=Burkholderia sp. SRS-W-2-2016 TaxID=1926878 RepID=UPI00094AE894|nr:hypothetical protein [Burkholderia sp. SRS-W-2-2016]OLL28841.1 hypothetical protein BTH42_25130 [Burkholderia sp. SRS-W-2-2016]
MKVLKMVVIACSLSATAAAYAQTAPAEAPQQVAQAATPRANNAVTPSRVLASKAKADECVGPVSFCNIYFGS